MIRSFKGKSPRIHPTAFVSEAAYVIGDVEIGEGSSVWPGAIIRGNLSKIRIGRYTNIQDNCVIHSDHGTDASYGDYVTLGHHVISHAEAVADHCLIGNGAVVNGYVTIGDHSIIASGSVVLDRAVIPPGSFVTGVPGEVRRPVTERHREMIDRFARDYYGYRQEFLEEGFQDPDQARFTDPTV